jgi:glycosyltransferase involved in cell wall biosynthesis
VISAIRTWARVCHAEGAAAVRDRLFDRWTETRQAVQFSGRTQRQGGWPDVPVLNVIGVGVTARGGGVPLQLRARLRHECSERPVALLARQPRGGFGLEYWRGDRWHNQSFASARWNGDPLVEEPGWLDVVKAASRLIGARAIHIENLAGLSLVSLLQLARSGLPLVISLHDFTSFCRHPHLWQPSGAFCDYSIDVDRCHRCLAASGDPFAIDQPRHRALAAETLSAAAALIFPSEFLRARLAALVPWGSDPLCDVVAPGVEYPPVTRRSIRREDQVAFIGGGADHKGGARLAPLARAVVAQGASVTVYGGNGHHNLRQLRRIPNVRVRGYFRAGSLPALLAQQGASVALLLSGVPESFSLALSDAWAAGVPVVAPAQGALSDRLQHAGGQLLSTEPSDDEVLRAIDRVRRQPGAGTPPPPTASDAARRHLDIYRRCGLATA